MASQTNDSRDAGLHFEEGRDVRLRRARGFRSANIIFLCALLLGMMTSCAPVSLYSVDLKYRPSKTGEKAAAVKTGKVVLRLAEFVDTRQVPDRLVIGEVVEDDGTRVRVFPKYARPADAVTAIVRDYLTRAGYAVIPATAGGEQTPALKEHAGIIIRGEINELEVRCEQSLTVKKYSSRAKLTVSLIDGSKGNVLYKVSAESGSTLDHYRFSEEMLAEQLDDAISGAVEKIFAGKEMAGRLRGMTPAVP